MKKLRLELDELAVESFSTSRDPRASHGTVMGQQIPVYESRYLWQCGAVSWDLAGCYSVDALCYTADGGGTCQPVYTCPECASPPQTFDLCVETNLCLEPVQ